ncbi:6-hydroxymethylpterin diphosphokinase MptE-like protein [Lacimicrobium alkaliphilum]|uniref:DUF115 domain-containing protein n=1 Tax=Lacimicrobium alkaliphilum TaxID=1526571 RepID=A0ABQ1RJA0_9ALTE|nr:6-hydroxymethylpterin diphosphokinase MptE-like protein [Lacimicrobium alkaliphilum]GGD72373.1 hypothetical protein GCM10011357_29220 [Lacimicrobium alkaliphilum]
MLKNIRLHLQQDEEQQKHQEEHLAEHIARISHKNINAFQRHIPSLLAYIKQQSQNISVFCNKYGDYNLVDYGTGRTFYGLHPQREIQTHLNSFTDHAPYISFEQASSALENTPDVTDITELTELPEYRQRLSAPPLPDSSELVVVLGIGLGFHIQELIEKYQVSHLLIYEPEPQYFKASTMLVDWQHILQLAKDKGTALYLQIEKDGRDFINNVQELREHVDISGAYLYQHYNHPVFDALYQQLTNHPWNKLVEQGLNFRFRQGADEYCPIWTTASQPENWTNVDPESERFSKNLAAFKHYFPDVYKEFKDYQPRRWLPVQQDNGEINIVDKHRLVPWYGEDPAQESRINLKGFSEHPHKDGLVLGYNGTKLKHYLHYQFVEKTEAILEQLEEEQGMLPETIKSMILFGLGCGYQLETLFDNHQVEKLFICEPNRDFFYASLFAIDWASILKTVDESDGRLYLNIGDDGTNLFRDLLNQFYAIGPYMLNSTYFYQGYYNGALNQAIAQLREQLQVVISMGEYFDHAYYGIAHTKEALRREYPFLKKDAAKQIAAEYQEVPVFLVGNGPSLDFSIDAIKEWQDKAIIVSCGTSLQVLHRNGIVPDFHAEIEQNRSTFDWASRVGDFDYLKKITLISCNGIHPDTCDLYKDVYLAFKEGESSSVSTLQVLGEENYQILKFAFPTVTNFAMNFIAGMGMKQVYLLGVDLGFAEQTHHHSKQSGYYKEDGEELYDYSQKNNTAIVVPGNFRKSVYTKHEFKVAKMLLEQSLANTKMDCYNCSDGAKVLGATSLQLQNILITKGSDDKCQSLTLLKEKGFVSQSAGEFEQRFNDKFSYHALQRELQVFCDNAKADMASFDDAEALIESQKKLLFLSYQQGDSLLFYFLYGTTNYANSVLTKILYSSKREIEVIDRFNQVLNMWKKCLMQIKERLVLPFILFDVSGSFSTKRYASNIRRVSREFDVLLLSTSERFVKAAKTWNTEQHLGFNLECFNSPDHVPQELLESRKYKLILLYCNPYPEGQPGWLDIMAQSDTRLVVFVNDQRYLPPLDSISDNVTIIYLPGDVSEPAGLVQAHDLKRFMLLCSFLANTKHYRLIIPRMIVDDESALLPFCVDIPTERYFLYAFHDAICVSDHRLEMSEMQASSGNRGDYVVARDLTPEMLIIRKEDPDRLAEYRHSLFKNYPFLIKEDQDYVQ